MSRADTDTTTATTGAVGTTADRDLPEAIVHAVLGGAAQLHHEQAVSGDERLMPDDHLELVRRCAVADRTTAALMADAVTAARGAGHSWSSIGDVLGLTRQAVQQRFGSRPADAEVDGQPAAQERWLGPVTAFDEMAELEIAGRQGWRTVGAEMLRHRMRRTDTQWEHRRVLWLRPAGHHEVDGWQVGCRAFPWLYLVRDLGVPAEPTGSGE